MKINWKQKLTSRKFWAAVTGFITPLMLAFGASSGQTTKAVSIVMAGATLIAYIIGEGFVDASFTGDGTDSTADTEEDG